MSSQTATDATSLATKSPDTYPLNRYGREIWRALVSRTGALLKDAVIWGAVGVVVALIGAIWIAAPVQHGTPESTPVLDALRNVGLTVLVLLCAGYFIGNYHLCKTKQARIDQLERAMTPPPEFGGLLCELSQHIIERPFVGKQSALWALEHTVKNGPHGITDHQLSMRSRADENAAQLAAQPKLGMIGIVLVNDIKPIEPDFRELMKCLAERELVELREHVSQHYQNEKFVMHVLPKGLDVWRWGRMPNPYGEKALPDA